MDSIRNVKTEVISFHISCLPLWMKIMPTLLLFHP